ncbi:PucR family transcriptional regulator [Peribacillus huizhouensis]|uniref:DNA-binding PucR family transcriptional regulator n=1 Tax=Peribacillus huizhouensis TaxID=1501239 RepID=A0ABR6CK37_9BACI|nr:PucR family transcriptional regulator [Peribacillus huizhouensis]MBA9025390.1 DNA-binding PucR family transcriptional regulator [Peribacillus huizhouensis]
MHGGEKNRDIFKGLFGDMMEFADRISSVLGGPVTIEDGNHRLLAYSRHEDTTDLARISTILGRRVPEKVINRLWNEGVIPALLDGDVPIKVSSIEGVGLGNRAAVSIRKNKDVLGFIWVLEVNQPFTGEDLQFLQLAAQEAKNQLLQHQLKKQQKDANNKEFLWRLLTGHFQGENDIKEALSKYSLPIPTLFSIIVFEFPEIIDEKVERHIYYMLTITQKIRVYLFMTDQNKLILLNVTDDVEQLSTSVHSFIPFFIREMKSRFGVEGILGSSGLSYSHLSNGINSYQEALYTLKIKMAFPEDTTSIIYYEDLGLYKEFDYFLQQRSAVQQVHPSITKLEKYDSKHQTELLRTLEVYFDRDCSQNDAAKQLHIHVNTLNYRLKRIVEIGHVRLNDPMQKMTIFLELKIRHYKDFLRKK